MNSRYLAGLSLTIMACGFTVTLLFPETTVIFLLRGGFEAGLVGGIADWFAVTALFRHPFGIPIPHTSLLLKNRDKIIRSLISVMEKELLNKKSIEGKLRRFNVTEVASSMLTKLLRKRTVRIGVLEFLIRQIKQLPIEKSLPFLQGWISDLIRKADVKAAAETVVTKSIQSGYDHKAFDFAVNETLKWVQRSDTRTLLGKLVNERLSEVKVGGLMGFAFQSFAGFMNEEKLGSILQDMLLSTLRELLNAENSFRERILQELRVQLFQLADNDERLGLLKEWAIHQLQGRNGLEFLHTRLEGIRGFILDKLEEERSGGGKIVFSVYRSLYQSIRKEPDWVASAEERLLSYFIQLVEANHYRIGQLVKENLDRMDDVSLVKMLEEKLGKDLQWIRVNGALCGFFVGFLLSLIQI